MKTITNWKSWLVLTISLLITVVATVYVRYEMNKTDETEFKFKSKNVAGKIETRLHTHALLLRSGAAFFVASDSVSREDWKSFVEHYQVDLNLPGIMGIGFAVKIPKDKLNEHTQEIRNEGFPEYVVWPEEEREIYTSIIFLEPFSGNNLQAFGYDMMTEPIRKEAMELARDMDVAALSGKVRLIHENGTAVQAGNIMYVPIYQQGVAVNTVEQRRAALKGWIYSAALMDDLISGILRSWESEDNLHKYHLQIYDGLISSSESLLFDSQYPEEQDIAKKYRFNLELPINFNGHHWTLVFNQSKGNIFIDYIGAWGTLVAGFIISLLLFLLTRSLINTKYNALKIAEKLTVELKESENKLHMIIETSPVPMILSKMITRETIIANETFGKLFKISASEIIGQKLPDFYFNKEDYDFILKTVAAEGFVDNFELVLKKSDEDLFWCSLSIKLLILNEEQLLLAAFHDISVRKKAEEEIIKHREHLEEMVAERTRKLTISEQKLRQSLREISDYKFALDESCLVAITDNRGIIKYANDKFCEVSKFSREELIGNTFRIINSKFHSKEFFKNLWTTISEGKIWRGEIRNKAKDGSYYWVDSTFIPFLDQNGKPYQYLAVRFDITKIKLFEADLIKSKEEAESANRAKSEFLANMSHEIRTPMNAVIGFAELLSKSVQDKKQLSQVESIRTSGKNLLKLINDILDLSKIEAGKIDIIPVPISLVDMLHEIENMFAQRAKEKGIMLSIECEKTFAKTLLLDEVRFRQILFNLIGNAVKFTDIGSVTLSVENRKNSEKEENIDLTILVEDTGIGIPFDQQEQIFDPFNQQPNQNYVKYGGTGLGLSITKKLVEKMGGSISFVSEVDVGTTFKIDLPNIPVLDTIIDVEEKAFDTSTVIFKPATVLIVDDNTDNRKLIVDSLENSPLTMIQATNGEEAVEMAKKYLPDLILMDLRMPVMDGYKATEILRKDQLTKSIPILAITASISSSKEKDNIEKTFDEYLLKPIDIKELFDKLEKHLKYELVETKSSTDTFDAKKPDYKLSEELKQKAPAFIQTLELEFMPRYKKAIKNQVMNEIEKFGIDLLHISEEMNCKMLIDYSNEIIVHAESFDFEKLIQTLRKFPELVDWLKAEANSI